MGTLNIRISPTKGRQPAGNQAKDDSTPGVGPRTSREEEQRYLLDGQYALQRLRRQEAVRIRRRENSMPPVVSNDEHNKLKSIVAMLERLRLGESVDIERLKDAVQYIDDRIFRGYGAQNDGKPGYVMLLADECIDFESVKVRIKAEINNRKAASGADGGTAPAPGKTGAMQVTENRNFGCLVVFDDFRKVLCRKTPFDLTDAAQARELLRFLCDKKAFGESAALRKAEILAALKAADVTRATAWRPSHVFRGKLAALYKTAIGRNTKKGFYWINP